MKRHTFGLVCKSISWKDLFPSKQNLLAVAQILRGMREEQSYSCLLRSILHLWVLFFTLLLPHWCCSPLISQTSFNSLNVYWNPMVFWNPPGLQRQMETAEASSSQISNYQVPSLSSIHSDLWAIQSVIVLSTLQNLEPPRRWLSGYCLDCINWGGRPFHCW